MKLDSILTISCNCEESTLIHVYNYLKLLLKDGYSQAELYRRDCSAQFTLLFKAIPPQNIQGDRREQLKTLLALFQNGVPQEKPADDLIQTAVLLLINETNVTPEEDIVLYRHLFLITRLLLREHDFAVIQCTEEHYYHVMSYFSLEAQLLKKCAAVYSRGNEVPKKRTLSFFDNPTSFSSEWLPAVFLGNGVPTYEALVNPIIKSRYELNTILQDKGLFFKKSSKGLLVSFDNIQRFLQKPQYYFEKPRYFFAIWICYQYRDYANIEALIADETSGLFNLFDKFCNSSGMTQLLFAMLLHLHFGKRILNKNVDLEKINNLFEWCSDLGDCILQIAENAICHTEGGILSIRSNYRWDSIKKAFRCANEQDNLPKKVNRYLRISLIDASTSSILKNIKTEYSGENVTYESVFGSVESEGFQKRRIERPDRIIHHYGLPVFCSIVESLNGCFTLFSSENTTIIPDQDGFVSKDGIIVCTRKKLCSFFHIPGSEYDVIFRLQNNHDQEKAVTPVIISPKYIGDYRLTNPILDSKEFFNEQLDEIVLQRKKELKADPRYYQNLKEDSINTASRLLTRIISMSGDPKAVWYFYLSPYNPSKTPYGRTEITAKILMTVISNFSKKEKELKIVLFGLTENQIVSFARQFALFYHTTMGNPYMGKAQLYVVSNDYRTDVLFAGDKLQNISNFASQRRLITGATSRIEKILTHIAQRESSAGGYQVIEPFPFELLRRMEGEKALELSDKRWYYETLNRVLDNDLHGNNLGCKLDNIHIQVGNVHNDSFYEARLLFENAYWYQVFAAFIYEKVAEIMSCSKRKKRILLYGYETYSEQMLRAAGQKLRDDGHTVSYAIFENVIIDGINNKNKKRIRYIEEFCSSIESGEDVFVVYVLGISQTQRTLDEMIIVLNNNLSLSKRPQEMQIVLVQFWNGQVKTHAENSAPRKECQYLILKEVPAYDPEDCPFCFPEKEGKKYLEEKPLITTNEASTIPIMLVRPDTHGSVKLRFKHEHSYTKRFLDNQENYKYLYYTHLVREGNHHQYYLRTAQLVHDNEAEEQSDLRKWFNDIKKTESGNVDEQKNSNKINVIVSPMHFSNEVFTSSVNEYVFDNAAYFINFNLRQEFRESFNAKFQNFCAAINNLLQDTRLRGIELNFFYVDDDISTGSTFNRAKSLIVGLLEQYLLLDETSKLKLNVHVFKALIILVSRYSREAFLNFFELSSLMRGENNDIILPVYCFLELKTPSIRSAGFICPICRKVERIEHLVSKSSLTFVERHWREKASYHHIKQLPEAKENREKMNEEHPNDIFFSMRGFRRLQCSEILWDVLNNNRVINRLYIELCNQIESVLNKKKSYDEKIEYLISFIKVISREHIIYQEGANDAAMRILLSVFSLFLDDGQTLQESFYKLVYGLIFQTPGDFNKENPKLLFQLYQIVIARLCTLGSNVLLNEERLVSCIDTGIKLQELAKDKEMWFLDFLCWQVKKNLASMGTNEVRVEKMIAVLRDCIHEENEKGMNQHLDYYYSLLLESVSDDTKGRFLLPKLRNMTHKELHPKHITEIEDAIREITEMIQKESYDKILQVFCKLMKSNVAYMFQARNGSALNANSSLTILEKSGPDKTGIRTRILRSEMRDFYANLKKPPESQPDDPQRPSAVLLCEIKDTVRIVRVEEIQEDHSVGKYRREPCLIAYVRLDYTDENDTQSDNEKQIFFAFVFDYTENPIISDLIETIRGFLSFRYPLVKRIEKDFKGNLFGEKAEAQWRKNMLSNDRAGSHLKTSALNRLIDITDFETDKAISVLFSEKDEVGNLKHTYELIYNNLIAMYYRKAISDDRNLLLLDAVNSSYCKLGDLINFDSIEKPIIEYVSSEQVVNNASLSYILPSQNAPIGKKRKPLKSAKMIAKRYLRAFVIDVFENVVKYGGVNPKAFVSVEEREAASDCLVVRSRVESSDKRDYLSDNYDLKSAIELDYNFEDTHGISIGSFARLLETYGCQLMAYYEIEMDNLYFCIKLPIIRLS